MIRAKLSFVAAVFGLLFSLGLYGCGDGDDDNSGFPNVQGVYRVYRSTVFWTPSGLQLGCIS
jgi:hypothetical protein